MSHDTDRDRRRQPIAGPPEGGGYGEYEHPYPQSELRSDAGDQPPPTPFRPQGRPRPQSQADGFARAASDADSERRGDGTGRHAGKGPKGYRRSDERIRETVSEVLARDGDLDASEIEVSVNEGEVTLEGSVPNRWSKRLAEDLIYVQPGVRDVHNRLRVQERRDEPGQ